MSYTKAARYVVERDNYSNSLTQINDGIPTSGIRQPSNNPYSVGNDRWYDSRPSSATYQIANTVEDLTLAQLALLPQEYQDDPRVNAHRQNLTNAQYSIIQGSYAYTPYAFAEHNFECLALNKQEAETKLREELNRRKQVAKKQDEDQAKLREAQTIADQKALADAQLKKEHQFAYKEHITAVMQEPANDITAYCRQYQDLEIEKLQGIEAYRKDMLERRKYAFTTWSNTCDDYQERTYTFLDKTQKLLNEYSVTITDTLFGNPLQHVLHQEFVDIAHDTADWHYDQSMNSHDRETVTTTLLGFVMSGQAYNRQGQLRNAFACSDFCWSLLDCTKKVTQYGCKLTISALKGITSGATTVLFKAIQLPRTISEMAEDVTYLSLLAGHHLIQLREESKVAFTKKIAQIMQDKNDLSAGTVTQWDIIERDFNDLKNKSSMTVEQVRADLDFVWQSLEPENILVCTEKAFKAGTEIYLTGKITDGVSTLFKNGSSALTEIIEAGGGARRFRDLPLTGGTLQAVIAHESMLAQEAAQATGVTIADHIDKVALVAPPLLMASHDGHGDGEPSISEIGNIEQKLPRKEKPRNWSPDEALKKLEELNTPTTRNNVELTGLAYDEFLLAHNLFKDVPGFLSKSGPFQNVIKHCLTKKVDSWNKIKGFAFEIKKALQLEAQNIRVLEFGKKVGSREIDIITEKLWIECKDWQWEFAKAKDIEDLFSTAGQIRNAAKAEGVTYAIVSKQPIPQIIKDRLTKNNVLFYES